MFNAIQILALIAVAILILRMIRNRPIAGITGLLLAVFITLQVTSLYLIDSFVNYQFYTHLNWGDIRAYLFQFVPQFAFAVVLALAAWQALLWLAGKSRSTRKPSDSVAAGLLTGMILVLCLPGGVLRDTHEIYAILTTKNQSFEAALADLGIDPTEYPVPSDIHAAAGKNILVISMESLERGFLGPQFPGLTPNLNRLSEEFARFDMPLVPGTGWTAGSLYGHHVGMPALFKGQGNDYFQDIEGVLLTGLGHVLREAGYYTRYLMGKPDFAGTADLLSAYRMPVVSEKSSLGNYPESDAGLNDLDLFEEAKLQVREAQKSDRPFALFLSTVNTHYPDGIHDPRMEEKIASDLGGLEFSVAALDWLIGDFFEFLASQELLDETVVYLFSDHMLMGRSGKVIEKLKRESRSSFLITSADPAVMGEDPNRPVYIIELPRLIIDGAGIQTNARFLADYVQEKNLSAFVNENALRLTALNHASVHRSDYTGGFTVSLSSDTLTVSSEEKALLFDRVASRTGQVFNVVFNDRMNYVSHGIIPSELFFTKGKHEAQHPRLHLTVQVEGEQLTAYLGDKGHAGITLTGEKSVTFGKDAIALVRKSAAGLKGLNSANQEDPEDETVYASNVARVSSRPMGMPGNFEMGKNVYPMERGMNVFFRQEDAWKVENFDVWWSVDSANRFVELVRSLQQDQRFFAVAAQGAVRNDHPGYAEQLRELGLRTLARVNGRKAYIAYPDPGLPLIEFADDESITHVIPVPLSSKVPQQEMAPSPHARDTSRLIAHAGGAIDGNRYTNSLEALDNSYRSGFRLFELDIVETSDKHLVAAHDWELWQRISGFEGALPPTLEQFRSRKIRGRYTPLDMDGINAWFTAHPDAILVTDKVNDPTRFAAQFVDKERLMMELFSVEALEAGTRAGIRAPIANWDVVMRLGGNRSRALKEMGVGNIAVSRRVIDRHPELLRTFGREGIRTYAFHVNADPGKDEAHVVCNELNHFYGLYADTWNFEQPPACRL